ncbi:type II secretion system protein [Aquincola sp. S2]|uniref:Type II secretion system protein n=1 Tax=Pseudaquabacterium terrae TaxID=2732868 RepID=A0ABX2EKU1_9BURK|nr:type II secretion system protein [Aquabacterium terrae]NRF69144.1 type II secretion system protein [Aquabacterium terrae]
MLLLVTLAMVGMAAASAVSLGTTMARRDAEEALLVVGAEFAAAIHSYRNASAVQLRSGPTEFDHLLRDPRFPGIRRHLRKHYADPMSGSNEWGVLRDGSGAIVAVYSLAAGRPIKQEGFDPAQAGFTGATSYAQWQFGPVVAPARP